MFSRNPQAVLDSVCAVKRSSSVFTVFEVIDGENAFVASLEPNVEFQFNVIATIDNEQVSIPYKPVTLKVPMRPVYGGRLLVLLLTLTVILFGFMALYFFFKGKKLQ